MADMHMPIQVFLNIFNSSQLSEDFLRFSCMHFGLLVQRIYVIYSKKKLNQNAVKLKADLALFLLKISHLTFGLD